MIQRAKDAIADTIAAIAFGAHLPWSRMIVNYASAARQRRQSLRVRAGAQLQAPRPRPSPTARLAHAFEMDNPDLG